MQNNSTNLTLLSRLREVFWPIKRDELGLFVPMALIAMCVLFNFSTLRSIKDSLVVPNIGAEVISFLKFWLVLPSTIIFLFIYVKLSNKLNYESIFYLLVSSFLGFFALFTFVLYPNQAYYHPDTESINAFSQAYPKLNWFALIAGKWSYALMYIACELWSVVIINLLFWQYANHIFDKESAKRFYPIIGMVGNVGLILSGNYTASLSDLSGVENFGNSEYFDSDYYFEYECEMVLKPIITTVILVGIIAMMLYFYINRYLIRTQKFKKFIAHKPEKTTTKLSIYQSLKLICTSPYIGRIVLLMLCYGLLINILEGPWKSKLSEMYPNTAEYLNFMGRFNMWMGISSVCFMVIGSNVLRRCSWQTAAMITPLMILMTGLGFFIFVIFASNENMVYLLVNPLYWAVMIGAAQNILSKSAKYSLFDSTKEMTYIPLSLEMRTKGKAAVEVLGLKFGKAFGAFIQSSVFILIPGATFDSIIMYLMAVFVIIISVWLWNVQELAKEYEKIA